MGEKTVEKEKNNRVECEVNNTTERRKKIKKHVVRRWNSFVDWID